jgi:hypothetical protein
MATPQLKALTPREASIFACLVDTAVAPEPLLPPVAQTDCAFYFDRWLCHSPRQNRVGLKAVLWALELGPLAGGFRHRMRRLSEPERIRWLHTIEKSRHSPVRQVVKLIKGAAFLSYYGDDAIMRRIGYDADANVARGRRLRAEQGRP